MREMARLAAAGLVLAGLLAADGAQAVELTGAWATYVDKCNQVFTKKGRTNKLGFTAFSEQYGGGFIVEANQLRGKFASCTIKNRKEDGQTIHILASCSTDIMLSNVQFSLKTPEPDKIIRLFPGMDAMEMTYYRCPI